MTQDERNMLNDLANKIAQTPPPPKDPEAEEFIRTRIGSRPDALYVMTQTVLIQNLALEHAQQQIQQLQQRAGQSLQPSSGGSFLGQSAPQFSGGQQYSQPSSPQYYAPPASAPLPSAPVSGGGASFLRSAAQTAAGVVVGSLAFQGIESLFSHHGGFGWGGGGFGGSGFLSGAPVEETVVNNYYDNPPDAGRDDLRDARDVNDSGQVYDDASQNQVDDSDQGQLDEASYDSTDDGGGFDDNSGDTFA